MKDSNSQDKIKIDNSKRLKEMRAVLKKHHITRGITPEKLRLILVDLGPTYIKLGQIVSLHSDILPRAYCDELLKLTSDVEPMPFEDVIEVIEKSWGMKYTDVFKNIDETPLGSASIAQVHKAKLLNGDKVVVKVQRKGVYDVMARDIGLLHRLVKLMPPVAGIKNMVDLDMVLDEMWTVAQQEMDFLKEAENIVEFGHNNKNVVYVTVPDFYKEYTTDRVLVMEYIRGAKLTDRKTLEEKGYDCNEIGRKLVNNFIKQIMEDGFFHADPHPGNLRVREGKIVWLDMGMMGRLSESQRKIMIKGVESIALNDINMLEKAVFELCDVGGEVDHAKLSDELRQFLDKYSTTTIGEVNIPETMFDLMDIMKKNNLIMPHGVTMVVRGIAHIEGVLEVIAPDISMFDIAVSRMGDRFLDDFDLKAETQGFIRKLYGAGKQGIEIPTKVNEALSAYLSGEAKTNLLLQISGPFAELIYTCVRNLVIGMCLAGLLVGSAIICTTDMNPRIFDIPFLGVAGFGIATLMVLFLIARFFLRWLIKRHRKK